MPRGEPLSGGGVEPGVQQPCNETSFRSQAGPRW